MLTVDCPPSIQLHNVRYIYNNVEDVPFFVLDSRARPLSRAVTGGRDVVLFRQGQLRHQGQDGIVVIDVVEFVRRCVGHYHQQSEKDTSDQKDRGIQTQDHYLTNLFRVILFAFYLLFSLQVTESEVPLCLKRTQRRTLKENVYEESDITMYQISKISSNKRHADLQSGQKAP